MKGVLYTDGASRGNPGEAGAGFWIEDENGNLLAEVSQYVGIATNNVAEYMAVIWGLEEAGKIGIDDIVVKTDSELVARHIQGLYRVKNAGLKPLYQRVMKALSLFDDWKIMAIPRERNSRADKLANLGIDGQGAARSS